MSDIQKILKVLASALHNGNIGEDMCIGLAKALDAIPKEFHVAAVIAMLTEGDWFDA